MTKRKPSLWFCLLYIVPLVSCLGQIATAQDVKTGADNLFDTNYSLIKGKKVVLVTHAAARVYTGRSTAEEFKRTKEITLLRILTPEHGYYGVVSAGKFVDNNNLEGTSLVSLYGANRQPTRQQLEDADVVVVDLQDIGSRSYTYVSTMIEVMEACAKYNIQMVVLDRPNPLGGLMVDGSLPDPSQVSFVCRLPIPYVHGMTLGELAKMANGMGWLSTDESGKPRTCSLTVVRAKRWTRDMAWEQTGLPWYPTSPNIPTLNSVRTYPVTGVLGELGKASIGIGTAMPFMVVALPGLRTDTALIQRLSGFGVLAMKCQINPTSGMFAGTLCNGYYLSYRADSTVRPFTTGMALITWLRDAGAITIEGSKNSMFVKVCGTPDYYNMLVANKPWSEIERRALRGLNEFKIARAPYLLY